MTPAGRTAAIWSITVVVATAVLGAIFTTLDPQPGPMTLAILGFSSAEMNVWLAAVLLVAAGTFLFARYVARSIFDAATSGAPKPAVAAFILAEVVLLVLATGLGHLAVAGSAAIAVLMVLNLFVAATGREEHGPARRTH